MGDGGLAPPFLIYALDEMSGLLHAPAALPTEKNTWYALDRKLGGS
jgi:hypothetical protein